MAINLVFVDLESHENLRPLTINRPLADIRVGILKIYEKWLLDLEANQFSFFTIPELNGMYPFKIQESNIIINSSILPNAALTAKIRKLEVKESLTCDGRFIAANIDRPTFDLLNEQLEFNDLRGYEIDKAEFRHVSQLWHILEHNAHEIKEDLTRLTGDKNHNLVEINEGSSNSVSGSYPVVMVNKTEFPGCYFDTQDGPIYIGRNVKILPHTFIKGPCAILEHALVKAGTQIYDGTTIGTYCQIAGEIKNSVVGDFSNKGHLGYLGDSVIGSWCNLGANTTTSNLKNNFGAVRLWNFKKRDFVETGRTKCGTFMGDYVRTGINTTFNTGTVVGLCCNVLGTGYPDKYVPSFTWKSNQSSELYDLDKALNTIIRMQSKRDQLLTAEQISFLKAYHASIQADFR